MINAGLLLLMYLYKIIDESYIIDDRPTYPQTAIGTVVVAATFVIGHYVLQLYWAITLSMCLTYASNVNNVVQHVFARTKYANIQ